MRSILFLPLMLVSVLPACASTGSDAIPSRADVIAVTEAKPVPSEATVTDETADSLYNASVEAWGDRLRSAGLRLCRYFKTTGMEGLDCP